MPVALPPWLSRLRQTEVVERVKADPRSVDGALLGVPWEKVQNTIDGGQADFDRSRGNLSPEDLVLLYAYSNQLGHLEELTDVFRHHFRGKRPDCPIVVDIGCGPFTGGLAIAATLGPESSFDYLGVDRSEHMRRFGDRLASVARAQKETPRFRTQWARNLSSISWNDPPGWRPVIVIVSYLLASPTVDPRDLVAQLADRLRRFGHGGVSVLYTNSAEPGPNSPFAAFHEELTAEGFRKCADDQATIDVERAFRPKRRQFRRALWHRYPRDRFQPRTA